MKTQLTKQDWLAYGLKTLVTAGSAALKADPMAKGLGVSRGSFYWHFEDIHAFRAAILALWRDRSTTQVIRAMEEIEPDRRLMLLIDRAFTAETGMERAIRAWAHQDASVAETVRQVDAERIGYIEKLLASNGVAASDRSLRAAFVYWAYLGQQVSLHETTLTENLSEIERLILA